MLKYLCLLAVLLGVCGFVTIQDEVAAKNAAHRATPKIAAPLSPNDSQHSEGNSEDSVWHAPRWHRIFGWPDGVTAWAIILTLIAIAEQTQATSRSAVAAEKAIALQFRPRLIIRKIVLCRGSSIRSGGIGQPDSIPYKLQLEACNVGGSAAYLNRYGFMVRRYQKGLPGRIPPPATKPSAFLIQPGESRELTFTLHPDDDLVMILRIIGEDGLAQGYQFTDRIYTTGIAQYRDEVGIERFTSICRHYENSTGQFFAVPGSEYEYAD